MIGLTEMPLGKTHEMELPEVQRIRHVEKENHSKSQEWIIDLSEIIALRIPIPWLLFH